MRYIGFTNAFDRMLANGKVFWKRWPEVSPNADVFSKGVDEFEKYNELQQGSLGNCYVIATAASVSLFPELSEDHVLTKTKNKAGIYGFKIFIRGVPWVVSIDDNLLYTNKAKPELVFAKEVNGAMWGPLFEKTWAKVKGNYASSEAGFV